MKQKVKIIVLSSVGGRLGGLPVVNQEIVKGLSRLGHDVTLVTTASPDDFGDSVLTRPYDYGDAKVIKVKKLFNNETNYNALLRFASTCEPADLGLGSGDSCDLILGHGYSSGLPGVELKRKLGESVRLGLFHHGIREREFDAGFSGGLLKPDALRYADLTVGVGPLLAAEGQLESLHSGKISTHEMIPGPPPSLDREPPGPKRPNEQFTFLMLGRVDFPLKGMKTLVEAIAEVRGRGYDARAILCGIYGGGVDAIQNESDRLVGGQNIITVWRYIHDAQRVQELIEASDAMVMPSLNEPFGLVPYEAIAAGRPALVNRESGFAWFLNDPRRIWPDDFDPTLFVVDDLGHLPSRYKRFDHSGATRPRSAQWADRIVHLMENHGQHLDATKILAGHLQHFGYEHGANALVKAAMRIDPQAQRSGEQAPRHTIQGPLGTVIDIDPELPPLTERRHEAAFAVRPGFPVPFYSDYPSGVEVTGAGWPVRWEPNMQIGPPEPGL